MNKKRIVIYGPYFTSYSYARVNRGIASYLSKIQSEYDVFLYCSKEDIDYLPTPEELENFDLKDLVLESCDYADILIYNNFPKNSNSLFGLKKLPGNVKLAYLAWEESVYPKNLVEEINQNLHGVLTISNFVTEILEKNGINIPIQTATISIDDSIRNAKITKVAHENFKFVHVSTGKVRKGVDLLLKAYCESFLGNNNVELVIKSSPGPVNNIDSLILAEKKKYEGKLPKITHISQGEMSNEDIANITANADCAVYPSRAEGFGLPALEAMNFGLPVIVTNYSGFKDFCNETNSYLIDYKLVNATNSEFANVGAKWAEPNLETLKQLMQKVYTASQELNKGVNSQQVQELKAIKTEALKTSHKVTWEKAAHNAFDFIKKTEQTSILKNKNIAVLSFINNESGIAEYSENLYKNIKGSFSKFIYLGNKDASDLHKLDDSDIKRTWITGEKDFKQTIELLKKENINILHIQYHSGAYFPVESLDNLISLSKNLRIKVYLTFHAVVGNGFDYIKECKQLSSCDGVFIHNKEDYNYAKQNLHNLHLMYLPTIRFKERNQSELRRILNLKDFAPILATHGLLNTNKNLGEIIKSIRILKSDFSKIKLLLINAVSSSNILAKSTFEELKKLVKELDLTENVIFIPEFLSSDQIEIFLQTSNINIFAYSEVGESGSAAIRKGLASGAVNIVTNIKMFGEFDREVIKIENISPEIIAENVKKLLEDSQLQDELKINTEKFIEENLYRKKALFTLNVYSTSFNSNKD